MQIFALSSKTEVGSAGEQPIRDSLKRDKKMSFKGIVSGIIPLIFFRAVLCL